MKFILIRYLKYLLLARHRKGHGIHSPFVFDLVTKVFRNKTDNRVVLKIEDIRKKGLHDTRVIRVKDLGAGSAKMKENYRKVSDIVRHSSVPEKYGKLLYRMSGKFGNHDIIELGTSAGISTMYLSSASSTGTVHTIEGCQATADIARENFRQAGISGIEMVTGSFDEVLPEMLSRPLKLSLAFVDGNHRKEPVLRYFSMLAGVSGSDSVIIIDDIHSGQEMEEAWSEIQKHDKVSLTIDVFRMGMVFFREGMSRTHYIIRY